MENSYLNFKRMAWKMDEMEEEHQRQGDQWEGLVTGGHRRQMREEFNITRLFLITHVK